MPFTAWHSCVWRNPAASGWTKCDISYSAFVLRSHPRAGGRNLLSRSRKSWTLRSRGFKRCGAWLTSFRVAGASISLNAAAARLPQPIPDEVRLTIYKHLCYNDLQEVLVTLAPSVLRI